MYRNEVIDALEKLRDNSEWMRRDIEAPIHQVTNKDRKDLADLCLVVYGVFKEI